MVSPSSTVVEVPRRRPIFFEQRENLRSPSPASPASTPRRKAVGQIADDSLQLGNGDGPRVANRIHLALRDAPLTGSVRLTLRLQHAHDGGRCAIRRMCIAGK